VGDLGVEDDEGGHLIGTRFNSPMDVFNLVPQNMNLNRGYWKSMESDWASELEKGTDIRVEIQLAHGDAILKRPNF